MKKKRLLTALAIASVVLLVGCKKDDYVEVVGVCPLVISTSPANGATSVPFDKIITATFNEEMDSTTITQSSFTVKGTAQIAGTVTCSGATATFAPTSPLLPNTTYTGLIASTVKDKMGNALQADYVWSFTTGAILSPIVIATDPFNNAIGVLLNKTIKAKFSIPMNPSTINSTSFTIKHGITAVGGAISYLDSTATFVPTNPLLPSTTYTCTVTTDAENMAGTSLASNYVWTFTTLGALIPTVTSTEPANLATAVVLSKIIAATFSQVMDPLTITAATFTLKLGSTPVLGLVSYSGSTATFVPAVNLFSGNTYTATITTGAKNTLSVPLVNDYVWTFSTNVPAGPPVIDLKSVARFGIISGVGVSNNAGASVINNLDVGIYPGARSSVTGFPPATIVGGAIYAADDIAPPGVPAMLLQAKTDLTAAYLLAEGSTSPAPATVSGDQGGKTLAPGIYKSTSTLLIQSGDLTLDAQGDVNAVWIFQIASDFTTVGGAGGSVILSGGAQAKNIFWQTGSSATIGDYTTFFGNVMALTSITLNSHATATGRMLARNGSVVMTSTNTINKP